MPRDVNLDRGKFVRFIGFIEIRSGLYETGYRIILNKRLGAYCFRARNFSKIFFEKSRISCIDVWKHY